MCVAALLWAGAARGAEATYVVDGLGFTKDDPARSCPLLEAASCKDPNKLKFLELWSQKVKCWLCTEIAKDLSTQALVLIKELTSLNIGMTHGFGVQITGEWLNLCLPVYLLAIFSTTRGVPLQPWILYQFALNMIWTCRYEEGEFFRLFGMTSGQLAYVFGLIGQPYDLTPQIIELQEPERAAAGALPPPSDGQAPTRSWDLPLVIDVGAGLGADARYYLRQGFRVVAVEANPLALDRALSDSGTRPYLLSGQLTVLNAAIAGQGTGVGGDAKSSFWVLSQRPEQSKAVSWIAADGGVEVSVRTIHCADLLRVFGPVVYMKVDVEINTIDCLTSLSSESAAKGSGWLPPKYLSLEVEAVHLTGPFYKHLVALGYTHYKVCRQFLYSPGPCEQGSYDSELLGCGSGPFGDAAVDYKTGMIWRSLSEFPEDTEFLREFESGYDWFDVHVRLPD